MSAETIQKARDEMLRVAAQIKSAKAEDKPDALADITAKLEALERAVNAEDADSGGKPATVKETHDAVKEREIRAYENLIESMRASAEESKAAAAKVDEMQRKLDAEKDRRLDFDAMGRARGEFSQEDLDRLLVEPTDDPQIKELQKQGDKVSFINAFLRAGQTYGHSFFRGGKKQLAEFRDAQKFSAMVRALYTTGSGAGDEFIPTTLSSDVYQEYEMARGVEAVFPRLEMPTGEWKIPVSTDPPSFYVQGQSSSPVWADEFEEDSITAVQPWLSSRMGRAAASDVENALINGDTTSTHLDTGYTVASHDMRRLCDGLRDRAIALSMTADLSTWSQANIMSLLAGAGEYAANPAEWVCVPSVKTYLKKILTDSNFTSAEKLPQGMASVNVGGGLGVYYGSKVIPSGKLAANLNATGIYDGSTTSYTACLWFNPMGWLIGYRRGMQIEVQKDILNGQFNMVATMRLHPKKMANASTGYTEVYGYKIS